MHNFFSNPMAVIITAFGVLIFSALIYYIYHLTISLRILEKRNREYRRNLEEVDQQARLIVQTDLEMNEVQEEISHKMQAILALQDLSRLFNSSLNRENILSGFNLSIIKKMGLIL